MVKEIKPVFIEQSGFDELEEELVKIFKQEIYSPLMDALKIDIVLNSKKGFLESAIASGRVRFYRGKFYGKFNSKITKEIKSIGGVWSQKEKVFKLHQSKLPEKIKTAIFTSETRFTKTIELIKKKISKFNPAKIADKLNATKIFDTSIYKMDKDIKKSLEGITVSPVLTKEQRAKVALEYNNNMQKSIVGWTDEEIKKLRKNVKILAEKGVRADGLSRFILKRYEVSQSKAKFLARQETRLYMTKFRESRYEANGSEGYYWKTVAGSPAHPVRPMHKQLDGKFIKWNDKPITSPNGNRNHAGEDYNCRCYPRPVVKF